MGAGADGPLAVGLSDGGNHLFRRAGDCQARLVAADAFACSGVISVSMQKRNPEAKNSLATTT